MLENITGAKIKEQFKSNKKLRLTTFVVGGLIVAVLGYLAYRQFFWAPANEKSKENWYIGLNYAAADSTELAMDELGAHKKKYDGKIGGEIAQFLYARQLMNKGQYQKAIDELDGVKLGDTYVSVMTIGLKADCYSELKKYEDAANLYMEAADERDNDMTTPMYLFKAGLCAEKLKDFEKATELYQRIQDDYSSFSAVKQIEKYLARAKSKTTK